MAIVIPAFASHTSSLICRYIDPSRQRLAHCWGRNFEETGCVVLSESIGIRRHRSPAPMTLPRAAA